MSAGPGLLAVAVGVLALAVLVLVAVVVRQGRALRRLDRAAPAAAPTPAVDDDLDRRPAVRRDSAEPESPPQPEFVITHVGDPEEPGARVADRVVLSVALGEPLVKAVSLGHGVRRALSAESRNRIWFHVRREVKRSRKVRRREMREAWRQVQAERASEAAAAGQRDVA